MNKSLVEYIESRIIPMYDGFDAGHGRDHVRAVIEEAVRLAGFYPVDLNMVYAAAAYHDTGLSVDRKTHHLESGRIVREDRGLRRWFTEPQIEVIAQAAEDHRASLRVKVLNSFFPPVGVMENIVVAGPSMLSR